MARTVGTAVPLAALWSKRERFSGDAGTTAVGELFVDWLRITGQNAWQLLPLSETHLEPRSKTVHVPSPYKGYGVGFDPRYLPSDFRKVLPTSSEARAFRSENRDWLDDYAVFSALRDRFGTDDWSKWPKPIRNRTESALVAWSKRLKPVIDEKIIEQWRLHRAFERLRKRAHYAHITLIGDLPFYLPFQSPLVWAHRNCFDILKNGRMSWVSGVPDGPNSHYGRQIWGHPLYRWSGRKGTETITALWKMRMRFYSRFYDAMRLDHAKGFFNFGAISVNGHRKDHVRLGPGRTILAKIIKYGRNCGLELFAEDSGDRLEELRQALHEMKVPGIRILRWAYNEKRKCLETDYSDVRKYPSNTYAYSHVHDTETLKKYVKSLSPNERAHLCNHVGVDDSSDADLLTDRMIEALLKSRAKRVIIPIQDWLHSERRINVPGTEKAVGDRNWRYRCEMPVENLPRIKNKFRGLRRW